jgi:nuclear GTP-binding protein
MLRDWSKGKILWYTMPSNSSTTSQSQFYPEFAGLYAKDEQTLVNLKMRKELRKQGGVVRFTTGIVDSRRVIVDAPWPGTGGDEGSDEVLDPGDSRDNHESLSEDEKDGDDDTEEVPTSANVFGKRKRTSIKDKASKKVAFTLDSKSSVQAHSLAKPGAKRMTTTSAKESKLNRSKATEKTKIINAASTKTPSIVPHGEAYDFGKFF